MIIKFQDNSGHSVSLKTAQLEEGRLEIHTLPPYPEASIQSSGSVSNLISNEFAILWSEYECLILDKNYQGHYFLTTEEFITNVFVFEEIFILICETSVSIFDISTFDEIQKVQHDEVIGGGFIKRCDSKLEIIDLMERRFVINLAERPYNLSIIN